MLIQRIIILLFIIVFTLAAFSTYHLFVTDSYLNLKTAFRLLNHIPFSLTNIFILVFGIIGAVVLLFKRFKDKK
ncbi:hypothetical protein AWX17_20180 [Priestia megaterium]|nr:hypothetical protein AWX17_20180 [Priestia megaterium]